MAVREVTINISPAAIIGDVTLRGVGGRGGEVFKQPPPTLALFIRKTSMAAGLFYLLKVKIEERTPVPSPINALTSEDADQ